MDKQDEPVKKELNKFASKQKWVPKITKESKPIEAKALSLHKDKEKESPPFLLTLRIAGRNLHNYMVDSGAAGNVMPH